jgi:predicted aspartyl protease
MGTFYTSCRIENSVERSRGARNPKILVDTGSEYTWVPERVLEKLGIAREKKDLEFLMANGQKVTRSVGFAIIRLDGHFTIDEVVFAEKGDLLLLGARTLEGLSLRVDPRTKKLVASGPLPAAAGVARDTAGGRSCVVRSG